jgi:alkylation response protein AidB-like acyl-CoA dehydrogenase
MAQLDSLSFCDYSLAIKAGVHFTLCGGTICKLGTAKHHEALLPRLNTLDLPGCFGMTELGHGSNVMGIETKVGGVGNRLASCLCSMHCWAVGIAVCKTLDAQGVCCVLAPQLTGCAGVLWLDRARPWQQ